MRVCRKCGVELIAGTNLYSSWVGRQNLCRNCHTRDRAKYNRLHRDTILARHKQYYSTHKERMKAQVKATQLQHKLAVVKHYGGHCVCCGETNPAFLTIGHKNDDGTKHRKETGGYGGQILATWLVTRDFETPYELQLECFNCNNGKIANGGICPHKSD